MAEPVRKAATYEDVLNAPPDRIAEILDGELHSSPRPAKPHAAAVSALAEELGPPFKRGKGGPGGWIILFEPELHLGADVLVPALAGWRRERLPVLTTSEAHFTLAPDWVCAVLSRGTAAVDRKRKLPIYAREAVRQVWLVDPLARTLDVLRLSDRSWTLVGTWSDDDEVRAEPFEAVALELRTLWADVVIEPEPGL